MRVKKRFLDRVYETDGSDEVRALYATWSESYDAEVAESGYATPRRCAQALARCVQDRAAPVLDIGCGTGLSGVAFRAVGLSTIDGSDFSAEMLAEARAKGIYRDLIRADLNDPLPFAAGDYAHAAAVGVFSPDHAPPETIDAVMNLLPPGGCFVFSLNDHALQDRGYHVRLREWTDCGSALVEVKEYGPHLPKIGLKAMVYVLRKRG